MWLAQNPTCDVRVYPAIPEKDALAPSFVARQTTPCGPPPRVHVWRHTQPDGLMSTITEEQGMEIIELLKGILRELQVIQANVKKNTCPPVYA